MHRRKSLQLPELAGGGAARPGSHGTKSPPRVRKVYSSNDVQSMLKQHSPTSRGKGALSARSGGPISVSRRLSDHSLNNSTSYDQSPQRLQECARRLCASPAYAARAVGIRKRSAAAFRHCRLPRQTACRAVCRSTRVVILNPSFTACPPLPRSPQPPPNAGHVYIAVGPPKHATHHD